MTDRELMQMALDTLEEINKLSVGEKAVCLPGEIDDAMDALRDRLAQPDIEVKASVHIEEELRRLHEENKALRDRLAQPEPEPVAWLSKCYNEDNEFLGYTLWDRDIGEESFPVYTTPPSIEAAVLAEREACADVADIALLGCERSIMDRVVRAIQARGEK